MDGLSAAASAIAVISLAIQLAETVDKLHGFLSHLKDAPKEIYSICTALSVISSILRTIQHDQSRAEDNAALESALLQCQRIVRGLNLIAEDLMPGFVSASKISRSWTALKAVKKAEKIKAFQQKLEQAKTTLLLAQQNSARRLQTTQHQDLQQSLQHVTQVLEKLQVEKSYQSEVIVAYNADRDEHLEAVFEEVRRMAGLWSNPFLRSKLEGSLREAVQNTIGSMSEESATESRTEETQMSATLPEPDVTRRTAKREVISDVDSTVSTMFGEIHCHSKASWILRQGQGDANGERSTTYRQQIFESSFWLVPSWWLVKCGLSYAVHVQVAKIGQSGWQNSLKAFNLVPDDALIFNFCANGNLDGVQTVLSKGLASVRDVNSNGATPLHVAAASCQPRICRLLLQKGSDISAQKWDDWHQTPFTSACYDIDQSYAFIQHDKEHRQIETFREFLAAGEDIEEVESKALTLAGRCELVIARLGLETDDAFVYPSLWILERFIIAAKQDTFLYDSAWWSSKLLNAMIQAPGRKPMEEIMKYCDKQAVEHALIEWISMLGFYTIDFHERTPLAAFTADLLTVYKKLGTLNFVEKTWDKSSNSYILRTPTSVAMKHSLPFIIFRSLLRELALDTEDFVRKEVEVCGHGWTEATLLAVFNDDYQPHRIDELRCRGCHSTGEWVLYKRDWLWDQRLVRIKAGQDVNGPFSQEELRAQEEWKLYVDTYMNDHVSDYLQDWGCAQIEKASAKWLMGREYASHHDLCRLICLER